MRPGIAYKLCMRASIITNNTSSTTRPPDPSTTDDAADGGDDVTDRKWSSLALLAERESNSMTANLTNVVHEAHRRSDVIHNDIPNDYRRNRYCYCYRYFDITPLLNVPDHL